MTEALEQAVDCLRVLPEDVQNKIASALLIQLREEIERDAEGS